MNLKNIIYCAYFVVNTNYSLLSRTIKCTADKTSISKWKLVLDMFISSLKFGSSFVDYYNFQFYNKSKFERSLYATMGFMYNFHKAVNDQEKSKLLDNKDEFAKHYKEFCNTPIVFNNNTIGIDKIEERLHDFVGKRIVFKDPTSTAGRGVYIGEVEKKDGKILLDDEALDVFIKRFFKNSQLIYAEKYLVQHQEISNISPTALNTIRVITIINEIGDVEVIGAIFRISVNSKLDNFSKGNLAAEIDIESGQVITGGIIKDSSCGKYHNYHPITKAKINGFKIPMWTKVIQTVKNAAQVLPEIRSIGWDVAILEDEIKLIEGNSKWNKDTWQIPAGYGKKELIKNYIQN